MSLTLWKNLLKLTAVLMCVVLAAGCSRQARTARYLARAERYFQAGQFEKAEIEYLNALRLDDSNLQALAHLGNLYYDQGRFSRAIPLVHRSTQLQPDDFELLTKMGVLYKAGGKFKEATADALAVLRKMPSQDDAWILLAESSMGTNELAKASEFLESRQGQAGNRPGFQVARGILLTRQIQLAPAEAAFKQALVLDPKFSPAHLALGTLYWYQNDTKRADTSLKAATDFAPARSPLRLSYPDFKIRTGDLESAKRLLTDITKVSQDYVPAWIRLGELALIEKKFEDCAAFIKKTLDYDPGNYDTLLLRGRLWLSKSEPDKAISEFEQLIVAFPGIGQTRFHLARAHLMREDLPKALASLHQAVTLDPNLAEAVLLLAQLNLRHGDSPAVISAMTQLIKQRSRLPQAYALLGQAYQLQGRLDAALAAYRRWAEISPNSAEAAALTGAVLEAQNNKTEARQAYERALQIAPGYLGALESLVDLDIAEGQFAAALERAQQLAQKAPAAAEPQLLLGKVYLAQKDPAHAEPALLRALELDHNAFAAYALLARIYVESHRPQQAVERLNLLLEKDPKNLAALLQIAVIQDQMKNYEGARQAYERLLAIRPQFGQALNNLAYIYSERLNQLDKAYDLATRARELQPSAATADTLGWILYKRGEYFRALPLLQESAQQQPGEPEVQFHLGMTQYMLGQEPAARTALQRTLELDKNFPGQDAITSRLAVLAVNPKTADLKVLAELEKQLAERPDDPVVLARVTGIYERQGALDQAIQACENVLKQKPNHIGAMVKLVEFYSSPRSDAHRAMDLAKSARKLAPNDPSIAHTLGHLAFQNKDYPWALSLLQESAIQLPNEPDVAYDLAWAFYSMGRVGESETAMLSALRAGSGFRKTQAAKLFLEMTALSAQPDKVQQAGSRIQEILKSNPSYIPALTAAALIQERQGDFTAAQRTYERILLEYPSFSPALRRLAILCARQDGNLPMAYESALKAREAFPDDREVAKALGLLAYRRQEYRRALDLLMESAGKNSNDAEILYYLGMANYHLKQKAESKRTLTVALGLDPSAKLADEAKRVLAELK